ncbi:hypothetical protein QQS21_006599 [Conoideocrella luteorostrata]|uniref:WD40 domain-containing protein n=1 Tax=Conoideocrella luteorostrata TaxID=1105319 RepID=A0AAJ0CPQ1_9HYPO|nr:hypothetical protein QQS21_006599 [Conoideocrella luteorostrata]
MQYAEPAALHRSSPFKSSSHCKPSPNGLLVAALISSTVIVRSTKTLQTVHTVKLSPELTGPISNFIWSPSSTAILISAGDQIQVSSVSGSSFNAIIQHPAAPVAGKLPLIRFGATDMELLACAPLGLKFMVFDLSTSKAVEIGNPKFFHSNSASRGFSIRPGTGHLVVLTRTGGKDMLSIHHPSTRQITRSWHPDAIDAQGVQWSPDGQWIIAWDAPVQGRRLFVYTSDGQHYRTLSTSQLMPDPNEDPESDMELGIRNCHFSSNAELCVVRDHSRGAIVLQVGIWRSMMRLWHPAAATPSETLQVWQEQVHSGGDGSPVHTFVKADKAVSPPTLADHTTPLGDARSSCSLTKFDASSTLLAITLDDCPCTIWIWDLGAAELRAAIIFHSVVHFSWHPTSREVLLISSLEDGKQSASYIWDPLSRGPKALNAEHFLPTSQTLQKAQVAWLHNESATPELLASDTQHYTLLSLADAEYEHSPWEAAAGGSVLDGLPSGQDVDASINSATPIVITEDISKLDDTFSFKYT